ncbi:glycosyl hydrolase 108 family protein [Jiulongibacter sp. NS-SX5]|uniref:glycosyl hydrolase 108 family protein n=1 Tax=Jiulongibacter sp. NS-SX5 TaxID=3463854 RepID=UPI004058B09C
MRVGRLSVFMISISSLIFCLNVNAASFEKYAPKLLFFEGAGFGIHKPIWGEKDFTKSEALRIHRQHYWDRYHGDLFKSQEVAEVLIDHIINAGPGRNGANIKAFEAIIGVKQDGILSVNDVKRANSFYFAEQIVNPYVKYRVLYYKTRSHVAENPGWLTRAKSFLMKNAYGNIALTDVSLPDSIERKFRHVRL